MTFRELPRLAVLLAAALLPAAASAALKVVTTTEGLASLAREVGGSDAQVTALSRGIQDPHFVDANPTLALKLRDADLLVDVGLDLEVGWLPPLVNQSRNADIQPGGRHRLTAAAAVTPLDVPTGPVDRSMGDLHPGGNPHLLGDPRRATLVARAMAAKMGELDPPRATAYAERAAAFGARIEAALGRWRAELAPLQGRKLFSHHKTLSYFYDWTGLADGGVLEPRPGTPPPPAHLARLVEVAKREGVKAIVVESYYDTRSGEQVARLTGARLVSIPGDVGGDPAGKSYESYVDLLVHRIAAALRS